MSQTTSEPNKAPSKGEIILYQTADGRTSIDVKLENETVWLTQSQMAVLFETTKQNISLHVNNVFKEGELEKEVVVKESLITTQHGAIPGKTQTSKVSYYNLDVIISVGYRVKSRRGTPNSVSGRSPSSSEASSLFWSVPYAMPLPNTRWSYPDCRRSQFRSACSGRYNRPR